MNIKYNLLPNNESNDTTKIVENNMSAPTLPIALFDIYDNVIPIAPALYNSLVKPK